MLYETYMRGRSLFTSLPSHQLNQACRDADQDLVTHAPKLSCVGEAPHPCACLQPLVVCSTPSLLRELGCLHQTAVLAARVQLGHSKPCPLAVDSEEDLNDPFVPHFAVVGLAPHADFDLGVVWHVDGCL